MSWRDRSGKERTEFFDWAAKQLRLGIKRGKKDYPDIFQGEPLDQAVEEAVDLLFYLFYMKRKLENLQEMLDV